MDSEAEKVFTSLQLFFTPPSASLYLDILIVQAIKNCINLFTFPNNSKLLKVIGLKITSQFQRVIKKLELYSVLNRTT